MAYSYEDLELSIAGIYYYWLQSVDYDGISVLYGPVSVELKDLGGGETNIPLKTAISSAYPNPFNPRISIAYQLSSAKPVKIDVYNGRGQLIKTLVNESKQAGQYTVEWNGSSQNGNPMSSGIYYLRMQAGSIREIRKITLQK